MLGGVVAALIAQPNVIRSLGTDAIGPALGLGETYLGTAYPDDGSSPRHRHRTGDPG